VQKNILQKDCNCKLDIIYMYEITKSKESIRCDCIVKKNLSYFHIHRLKNVYQHRNQFSAKSCYYSNTISKILTLFKFLRYYEFENFKLYNNE